MRPEVLKEYEELKKQYIKAGWGIYDDTSDLDRAIICSDIYYGDQSSVMELYRITGKPILYQEMEYTEPAEVFDVPVWTQAMCSDGESLWFVEGKINILMRYHIKSHRLICEGFIPKEARMQEYAFRAIAYADGKIFILPFMAEWIHVYDVERKVFLDLDFPLREQYKNTMKFREMFVYDDVLYCIPYQYEYFLRIHISSFKVEIAASAKELYLSAGLSTECIISDSDWYSDGVVVALVNQTNKAIYWDINKNFFDITDISKSEHGYGTLAVTSKTFCLAGRDVKRIPPEDYVEILDKSTGEKVKRIRNVFFAVRSLTKENVVLWNAVGHWAVFNMSSSDIIHEGGKELRPKGALQFFNHSFICCREEHESYGLSCHDNIFYIFNENGEIKDKIRLSLRLAENLPQICDFAEEQMSYEMPGMLDELLFKRQSMGNKTAETFCGGKIYAATCK